MYEIIKGVIHYGICKNGFEEATRLELEWFGKNLNLRAPGPGK